MVQQGTVDKHTIRQWEHVENIHLKFITFCICKFWLFIHKASSVNVCVSWRFTTLTRMSTCSQHTCHTKPLSNQSHPPFYYKIKYAGCPPVFPRGVLALCLQTDKDQRDLVFWSTLKAQRPESDSRWLMEAQRKGPLRNREALNERSAQKDSRLTIGWLDAKLRASNKRCEFTPQWRRSSEGQTYM